VSSIAKHSRAKNVRIFLEPDDNGLKLLVEDDGIGFTRKKTSQSNGFGLWGMRERISALGGKLRVRTELGKGTQVRITLPVANCAMKTVAPLVSTSDSQANYSHAH